MSCKAIFIPEVVWISHSIGQPKLEVFPLQSTHIAIASSLSPWLLWGNNGAHPCSGHPLMQHGLIVWPLSNRRPREGGVLLTHSSIQAHTNIEKGHSSSFTITICIYNYLLFIDKYSFSFSYMHMLALPVEIFTLMTEIRIRHWNALRWVSFSQASFLPLGLLLW